MKQAQKLNNAFFIIITFCVLILLTVIFITSALHIQTIKDICYADSLSVPQTTSIKKQSTINRQDIYLTLLSTTVYSQPCSSSPIIATLGKNQIVDVRDTIILEKDNWYEIYHDDNVGYVLSYTLYKQRPNSSYKQVFAKVSAERFGEKIYIYTQPFTESQTIATISDGKKVLVTQYDDNFFIIQHQDKAGYIRQQNITTGITYYQRLALIVSIICVLTVMTLILLAYLNKNKLNRKK